ncbi:MAG: S8 family serine peptidase [Pseudomonadota bacterium]
MRGSRWVLALLLLALAACAQTSADQAPPWTLVPAQQIQDERHLIVTVALAEPEALAALAERLEADHAITLIAEWPLKAIDVHCFVFRATDGLPAAAVMSGLAADPRVRTVQPMQRFETAASPLASPAAAVPLAPNEASPRDLSGLQEGLTAMRALPVHRVATGRGVRVAVVDTRPDSAHADLVGRIGLERDFVGGETGEGAEEHGTAIAGVIAAAAGDASGITGVAPEAEVLALRGCWEPLPGGPGRCTSFTIARALNFALGNGVDVLNLSLGGPHDPLLAELVAAAVARDIVVVAATGESVEPRFPASAKGVVPAVSWPGPAPGDDVLPGGAIIAPGRDVLSTAPFGAYDFYSGSSIAAAHVSGVAALLLDLQPELTAGEVHAALMVGQQAGGIAPLLDACAAVRAINPDAAVEAEACGPVAALR